MTKEKKSGGVSISGRVVKLDKGTIVAGRDVEAQISITEGIKGDDLATVKALFDQIYESIETRDLPVDKGIVKTTVEQIEEQVTKSDGQPDEGKIESLMKTLKAMAPDIFDVAITTFANPPAGVAIVIKKIGEKIKAEAGQV